MLLQGPGQPEDGQRRLSYVEEEQEVHGEGRRRRARPRAIRIRPAQGRDRCQQEAAKGKKAAKEPKPKKLSLLDAAAQVLKAKGEPMRCKDMVATMVEKGLWKTSAPTPEATLYSAILREITTKKNEARFKKSDRGLFAFNG